MNSVYYMEYVYIIVENGEVYLPNAFTSYKDALDEVKKKYDKLRDDEGYEDWRDNEENEVDVEEGHKVYKVKGNTNPNITELYIEKEIKINIYKLEVKFKSATISSLENMSYDAIKLHNIVAKNASQRSVLDQQTSGGSKKKSQRNKMRKGKKTRRRFIKMNK